jgi:hypothetical protein
MVVGGGGDDNDGGLPQVEGGNSVTESKQST